MKIWHTFCYLFVKLCQILNVSIFAIRNSDRLCYIMGVGSKIFFYPTLMYNMFMKTVSSRRWYDRIDRAVIVGALPFRSYADELVNKENVRGVVSLNEDFELKYTPTAEEWGKLGVEQLHLPTVDFAEAPSMDSIEQGIEFMLEKARRQESVYVHCKAGRTRSVTLVGCYLMKINKWTPQEAQVFMQAKRPHIILKDKHFRAMYRYYDKHIRSSKGNRKGEAEETTQPDQEQ